MLKSLCRQPLYRKQLQNSLRSKSYSLSFLREHRAKVEDENACGLGGWGEHSKYSVEQLMSDLHFPVSVVGTRKPGTPTFFSWDLNAAFIRDIMNPHLYLTFQDSNGTVLGPVCYSARIVSYGPKIELGPRLRWGYLSGNWNKVKMDEIPETLNIEKGWDGGISCLLIGLCVTQLKVKELPGVSLWYFGWGSALGWTIVSKGSYKRREWLYLKGWSPARKMTFAFFCLLTLIFWYLAYDLYLAGALHVPPLFLEEQDEKDPSEVVLIESGSSTE